VRFTRTALATMLAVAVMLDVTAAAAQERTVRIGVMNDQSSVYADYQGRGSVLAAQMAVEDFGGTVAGRKIEILSADHQNKPDVGSSIARDWLDQRGVHMIADLPNSAVAFAVNEVVRERNKVLVGSGAGSVELTGARC
jgi:branched-chain amino acid transport system substrate-binding protein